MEPISDEVKRYNADLVARANQDRLTELFASRPPAALYYHPNRNGVSTVVLQTTGFTEEQLIKLLRYRLAQYIQTGYVVAQTVYDERMEYEARSHVGPGDIHFLAGDANTGEILCYVSFQKLEGMPAGATLRTQERPLYPVEEAFGWGIFNHLTILPDLPASRVFEFKRFVKNQSRNVLDEASIRAPIELGVAVIRTLTNALPLADGLVGTFEEDVAKRNLDFFHIPSKVLHGVVPHPDENDYVHPYYIGKKCYPFAIRVADMAATALPRAQKVEQALEQPGKRGLLTVLQLKNDLPPYQSSLMPAGQPEVQGEAALAENPAPLDVRSQVLNQAGQLRKFGLFSSLSDSEEAVLRSFMEPVEAKPGDVIVRQGEAGDAIYLIEAGSARVNVHIIDGSTVQVAQLKPEDYFGEISIITGWPRTADVVAATPMKLLRLTRETYMHYLAKRSEVEQQMATLAAERAADTVRKSAPLNRE